MDDGMQTWTEWHLSVSSMESLLFLRRAVEVIAEGIGPQWRDEPGVLRPRVEGAGEDAVVVLAFRGRPEVATPVLDADLGAMLAGITGGSPVEGGADPVAAARRILRGWRADDPGAGDVGVIELIARALGVELTPQQIAGNAPADNEAHAELKLELLRSLNDAVPMHVFGRVIVERVPPYTKMVRAFVYGLDALRASRSVFLVGSEGAVSALAKLTGRYERDLTTHSLLGVPWEVSDQLPATGVQVGADCYLVDADLLRLRDETFDFNRAPGR